MNKPHVRTSTSARVTVTVEVRVGSTWGPRCDLAQVYGQATEEAIGMLRSAFTETTQRRGDRFRIVGTPRVSAITTDVEVR